MNEWNIAQYNRVCRNSSNGDLKTLRVESASRVNVNALKTENMQCKCESVAVISRARDRTEIRGYENTGTETRTSPVFDQMRQWRNKPHKRLLKTK